MGQVQSIDPSHVRIYNHLVAMNNPATRLQTLETLMVGPEYVGSARRAGIYAGLLGYMARLRSGDTGAPFPGQMVSIGSTGAERNSIMSPAVAAAQVIQARGGAAAAIATGALQAYKEAPRQAWQVVTATPTNKAIDYFQQCLQVLGFSEDQSITEEQLKVAYKRAAIRVHPDKGGTEQQFEAVTRAYAYLAEILQRIRGVRKTTGSVEAPAAIAEGRTTDAKRFEQVQPVRIDPKNVNMNQFNQMFEQTRLPDPDSDGYGDWLKGQEEEVAGPKFSGKFNRDVFMRTFEEESRRKAATTQVMVHPEMMALNSSAHGVALGRDKPTTFTAPANASLKYTDLRDAYTVENTISPHVANVRIEERNLKEYQSQYKSGPSKMSADELMQMDEETTRRAAADKMQQRRIAEEGMAAQAYFEKMKQLVLTK